MLLETTEDKEDKQEATARLRNAKEISVNTAVAAVLSGGIFTLNYTLKFAKGSNRKPRALATWLNVEGQKVRSIQVLPPLYKHLLWALQQMDP